MTYVDHFSRMVVIVLLWELDAWIVVSCFLEEVISHYGLSVAIISDGDPRFQGNFWEFMKKLNISPSLSMATYLQTDRLAEVTNHIMEKVLYLHL